MKKAVFLPTLLFTLPLLTQESPVISSAIIALDHNNDLKSAKEYIDQAEEMIGEKNLSEIRYKDLRKFYYYKGKINYRVYISDDETIKLMDHNALQKAYEGYKKTLDYEKEIGKIRYTDEAKSEIQYVANDYTQRGIARSQSGDYDGAYEDFIKAYQIKRLSFIGVVDTAMLYNAALIAQNAEKTHEAIMLIQKLIDLGYKGVTYQATEVETGEVVDFTSKKQMKGAVATGKFRDSLIQGDLRADLYANIANLYLRNKDTVKYEEYIEKGRTKFPKNERLLRAELQIFLENKEFDKAMASLNQAIVEYLDNAVFYYIKGYILHTEVKDLEKTLQAYGKAIEADSEYLEPRYMSGLLYVDEANDITGQMNSLKLSEKIKYKELQEKQKLVFENALLHFKEAYRINPRDKETLNALKEIYYKLKMYDEVENIQEEIDAM